MCDKPVADTNKGWIQVTNAYNMHTVELRRQYLSIHKLQRRNRRNLRMDK